MTLLSRFNAVRYRGINGLSLSLSPANLVTGVNGIGKTALLEAMWLFTGRYNPGLLWNANVQRTTNPVLDPTARLSDGVLELHGEENGSSHQLKSVYHRIADIVHSPTSGAGADIDLSKLPMAGRIDTHLDGKLIEGQGLGIQATPWGVVTHSAAPAPARPNCVIEGTRFHQETSNEYLQRYSDMVRENHKKEFTKAINLLLPGIEGVEILADKTGASYLSAVTTDGIQLPLHDLGGGVCRLSRLLLSFFSSRDGMLLSDEIENGIHHSALREVWNHARRWMQEWNVQLVATTHSAECIDAAMVAFADAPEDLSIHKLFMNDETRSVEAVTFTGEALEGARDLGLEVR